VKKHVYFAFQVTDIAAGYGFTVFAAKSKKSSSQLFGTGLNTDSQIGMEQVNVEYEKFSLIYFT